MKPGRRTRPVQSGRPGVINSREISMEVTAVLRQEKRVKRRWLRQYNRAPQEVDSKRIFEREGKVKLLRLVFSCLCQWLIKGKSACEQRCHSKDGSTH